MKKFASLFQDLDSMTKTNDRLDRLVTYFKNACPTDLFGCVGFWPVTGSRGQSKPVNSDHFFLRK